MGEDSAQEDRSMDASERRDEMRPITALFADIVGSTGLGERLAPGDVWVTVRAR
jgi:class 3 adenylate cyclase